MSPPPLTRKELLRPLSGFYCKMKTGENGNTGRLPCKKIDIHTHLSPAGGAMTAEQRLEINRRLGIGHSVILPASAGIAMTKQPFKTAVMGNDIARGICLQYPGAFSWFCNICPDGTGRTYRLLRQYREQGACGVGEFASQLPFDDPVVEHLLACCQELGLPFLFHMSPRENWGYGVVDRPGLPLLEKELQKFPDLLFIGHSKVFWYELAQGPPQPEPALRNSCPDGPVREGRLAKLFRSCPNLCGDLSASGGGNALLRDQDYGLAFLHEFKDRLMFGTDLMDADAPCPLSGWLDRMYRKGKIREDVYRSVCHDNAGRLLAV